MIITSHGRSLGQTDATVFEYPVDGHAPGTALTLPADAQEVPVTVVDLNVGDDLLSVNVQDQSATTFNPGEFVWHSRLCNGIIWRILHRE